jgi:uroporphyrin-III C-methyltransferase
MAAGRAPDEPMAFVCNASTDRQTVLETELGRAAEDVAAAGLEPPAIVVLGEVVRLRSGLDWLGALQGRLLVADPFGTRAAGKDTASG